MNTVTFYLWSLLMPIALPVALLGFVGGEGVLAGITQLFSWSLLFGGIPYLLTLALLSRPLMRGEEREYARLTMLAPLLMVAVQIVCGIAYSVWYMPIYGWTAVLYGAGGGLLIGLFTIGFGYTYVARTHTMLWLFRRAGWVC